MEIKDWDKTYHGQGHVSKLAPAQFLQDNIALLPKGKALDLAMGEGRNALYLASHGYVVTAIDGSEAAVEKCLQLARERDLDLVEVSPVAQPPVCKIMDYGAYQYQQEKKERKQKAKQKRVEIKGIRLGLNIGAHDLEIRKNQALKFFEKGDKVKVELILRGREKAFVERARTIMEEFVKTLGDNAVIEQPLTRQGGRLSLLAAKK